MSTNVLRPFWTLRTRKTSHSRKRSISEFVAFQLDHRIESGIEALGYTEPTSIQSQSIPSILQGRDLMGMAQTGTGKTAAFALPILQHLLSGPRNVVRALIIAPTREWQNRPRGLWPAGPAHQAEKRQRLWRCGQKSPDQETSVTEQKSSWPAGPVARSHGPTGDRSHPRLKSSYWTNQTACLIWDFCRMCGRF